MQTPRFRSRAVALYLVLSTTAWAQPAELLSNRGFETGDLSSWGFIPGEGFVTEGPDMGGCGYMNPHTPYEGEYFFSCSAADGTMAGTPLVRITQSVSLASEPLIVLGNSFLTTSCRFSGASGCGNSSSDDLATVLVEHRSGADVVRTTASDPLDPDPGAWRVLEIRDSLADGTDSLVLIIEAELDPGFASIDIGMDAASLRLCHVDLNGDLTVNTQDVLRLLNLFQTGDLSIDFNLDGVVNSIDVLTYLNLWIDGC